MEQAVSIETVSERRQHSEVKPILSATPTTLAKARTLSCLQPDPCHFCPGLAVAHLQLQVLLHCSLTTGMCTGQHLT